MEFKGSSSLDLQGEFIVSDNGNTVCEMLDYNDENKANAQLFITAPELLKELNKIKFDIDMGVINVRKDSPIYKGILRVIHKATQTK